MSNNIRKNLGHVTAYAYYKAGGGTMTEEEYTEYMADFGTAAETAVNAANEAEQSKEDAETAATTATNKATEASASATSASQDAWSAELAKNSAVTAKNDAVTAKTQAQQAKTAAVVAQMEAENAAGYRVLDISSNAIVINVDPNREVTETQSYQITFKAYKGATRLRITALDGEPSLSLIVDGQEVARDPLALIDVDYGQMGFRYKLNEGETILTESLTTTLTFTAREPDTSTPTYTFTKELNLLIVRDGADCCTYEDTGDGDIVITKTTIGGGN